MEFDLADLKSNSELITGGRGQLGSALHRVLPSAICMTHQDLDVTDPRAVETAISLHKPEWVLNAAAYTNVDAAESDREKANAVNVKAVENLKRACVSNQARLIHFSTDYVFDGDLQRPYNESDSTAPRSVYGRTKLEGERIALTLSSSLVVRTSWVFGVGRNFLLSILNAAKERSELSVVNDQIGLPTYAVDLAEGTVALARAGAVGLYHLCGGGDPCSWADLAEYVLHSAGSSTRVRRITTDEYFSSKSGLIAPRPANSVLDCSKAASLSVRLRPWPKAVDAFLKEVT